MHLKNTKANITNKTMKLLFIAVSFIMLSCTNHNSEIKNTNWYGVNKDSMLSISCGDSICEVYEKYRYSTDEVDTMKMSYYIIKDTIFLKPFDEDIIVESNLVLSENGLIDSRTGSM